MDTALTLLSIPLLLFFPGWAILSGRRGCALGMTMVEKALARVLASFLVTSFCGVLLAQSGLFSLPTVSLAALLCGLASMFVVRRAAGDAPAGPQRRFHPADLWLLVLAGVCLFASTHAFEVVTGGGDAGVYVNSGVLISDTGGFELSDDLFSGLSERERNLFTLVFEGRQQPLRGVRGTERRLLDLIYRDRGERFRGMFLDQGGEGDTSRPQFLPLLPVWMAILHGWGGLWGLLRVNVLLGLLSLCSVHFVGTRIFGGRPGAGMVLSGLLAVNVAQFWFIRYPSAELLVQMLFFCGAHLVIAGGTGSRPLRRLLFCGGGLLGAATMAKFFGIFLLLPLGLVWFFSRARGGSGDQGRWKLILGGLIPAALYGLISAALFSNAYLRIHFFNQQYFKFYLPAAGLLIIALLARKRIGTGLALLDTGSRGRLIRLVAVALLGTTAIYAYFIRPQAIEVSGSNNFVELGWYLSPLGLLLGLVGFAALLLGRGRLSGVDLVPFFPWAAFLVSLVVMSGTADMPLHIFSIRRMVPVTIPAFLLFSLVPLRWLWGRCRPLGPMAALVLALAMALLPLRSGAWKTYTHEEQDGAVAQLREMAGEFDPRDVLVFDNADELALPLRVICGHRRTLVYYGSGIQAHSQLTRFLQKPPAEGQGRNLFLTSQPTLFGRSPERTFLLSWPKMEMTGSRIPSEAARERQLVNLFAFPDPGSWKYSTSRIDVGGADFPFVDGFHAAATHHRRVRHTFLRAGSRSVIALPEGTVKVGLLMARVEDGPASVSVLHLGEKIDQFVPAREFATRTVKVSRDDGLRAPGELVISVESAAGSGSPVPSTAGVAEVLLMGRYGNRWLKAGDESAQWGDGWGPAETREEVEAFTVRWTGPLARIRAPGSAVMLRLNFSNGSRPRSLPPARVNLLLNGRRVGGVIEPGARFQTVDIPIPPSEYGRESQILSIQTNTWNPYLAGRGGSLDHSLGVVVESLEIFRPSSSLERGLARVAGGRHQEGLLLIEEYAEQFGRRSDWRIPLGIAIAHEKMGRVSLARAGYKESLSLESVDNESYRLLRSLAGRHDTALRDREHPGWREPAGEGGVGAPPGVSAPWALSLLDREGEPLTLAPGGRFEMEYADLDHDGLALVYLVAQHQPAEKGAVPAPSAAGGLDGCPPRLELLLDGAGIGFCDLPRERWQSVVLNGLPAPGTGHRLELVLRGATPVQIRRIQIY
jgi:hypothetical protein